MSTPAEHVIEICGGIACVARVCRRSENRIRRWKYPRERGGTGGLIPADMQVELLKAAPANGWPLTPKDFFPADVIARLQAEPEADAA